ncbi:U-box domain-containing protein [Thalictrum thalictroides]|uniref:U-box domain-containing protein n=1 Tax=Thalictrum thalictroides TaxID=46969 RepID=A0A7J6XFI1_THATH|nr:U-box domain-containing protein [Thalictrum thalictroides]
MRDPVTISTGQTYDRSSIESWISTGNSTCPVTRVQLFDFNLISNHTLRRLIQDWCVSDRNLGVERIPTLLSQASSESTLLCTRVSVLKRLRGLVRDSEKNRGCFFK